MDVQGGAGEGLPENREGEAVSGDVEIVYWVPPIELSQIPEKYAVPDPSKISKLTKGNTALDYEGHADITLDILEVDPNYKLELVRGEDGLPLITEARSGKEWVIWGELKILGVSHGLGTGTCLKTKNGDIEKELIGDLLRNCAMRFGFATKLWSKADRDAAAAQPAGEAKIDQATADMFVEHWKSIADNDIRLEVNRQLVALGDNKIHQLPASVLGQVASIILNAKEKDWKALK